MVLLNKSERITFVHKLILKLTKNNFRFCTNANVHDRATRRNSRIHVFNPTSTISTDLNSTNAALATAVQEYNNIDSETRHLTSFRTFKARVKLKVIEDSDKFCVISPFYFI